MPARKPWLALSTLTVLALIGLFAFGRPATSQAAPKKSDRIALLYAEGVIMGDSPEDSFFGSSGNVSSIAMVQKLEEIRKDDQIKAVVIRVNSPGGSAAASQEIYDAIVKVKTVKPVYISMGDICASGGYYISAPATRVWATPATLTGSIGVIMELPRYDKMLDKIGVEFRTLKAGARKDIGSGTREMTPEERAILEKLLTTTHDQFIKAVSAGRIAAGQAEFDETLVRTLADGTIWTGEDAKAAGLVDELGGLQDVLVYAATQAGLDPDDFVVDEMTMTFMDELMKSLGMEMRGPFGGLQSMLGTLALRSMMPAQLPMAMPQQSSLPIPQTGALGLANRMFLCEPLLSGGLSY